MTDRVTSALLMGAIILLAIAFPLTAIGWYFNVQDIKYVTVTLTILALLVAVTLALIISIILHSVSLKINEIKERRYQRKRS